MCSRLQYTCFYFIIILIILVYYRTLYIIEWTDLAADKNKKLYSLRFYLIVSFIGGGAVMVCELPGERMIAPFYGATLFVWSMVIGVTLAALMPNVAKFALEATKDNN